jgi:hemoglobin-like flavoprotein
MRTEDHELLSQNLRVVIHKDSGFSARLYSRLFNRHPQLRELFGPNSAPVQEDMLTETLMSAVDDLEGLPWLEDNMQLLSAKHGDADVTHEMYDWWAECVVETLAELSAPDWNPRLEQLWRQQIERLCALMRAPAATSCPKRD